MNGGLLEEEPNSRAGRQTHALAQSLVIPAIAAVVLHGIVASVDPAHAQATIRHEAFDGMPGMTMTFSLDPRGVRQLTTGDRVAGTVDETTEPWTLRVTADAAGPAQPLQAPFVPLLHAGSIVPDAAFVDQRGRARSWRDFRGHTTIVSFVYTRCRDTGMCPLVSAKFAAMQTLLPRNARMIEFTLDPRYDTPAVLARYGAEFGAQDPPWTLATGDPTTLRDVALEFGVGVAARRADTIVHGEALGIVGRDGVVRGVVDGNAWEPEAVAAEVRQAEGLASNPWDRFMLGVGGALGAAARGCGAVDSEGRVRPFVLAIEGAGVAVLLFVALQFARSLVRWRASNGGRPR